MEIGLPEVIVFLFLVLLIYFLIIKKTMTVQRSKNFSAVLGDDTKAAALDGHGNTVIVDLPEGVKIQDVSAVLIGNKPGKLKVKLNHEAIDRRDVSPNNNDSMDL